MDHFTPYTEPACNMAEALSPGRLYGGLNTNALLFQRWDQLHTSESTLTTLMSLEDQCFWYVICNIQEFPPSALSLLPQAIRYRLLLNLPAVSIWKLEDTSVIHGVDTYKLWEALLASRCKGMHFPPSLSQLPYVHPREKYFAAIWNVLLSGRSFGHSFLQRNDPNLERSLYAVPVPLGVEGLRLSELNFQQSKLKSFCVYEMEPIGFIETPQESMFVAAIRYFEEVCHFRPKQFVLRCLSIGMYMWEKAMEIFEGPSRILQRFMGQVEVAIIDGRGVIPQRRRVRFRQFQRLFLRVPHLFLSAAVANPRCCLSSIIADMGDINRAISVMEGIKAALSKGYDKLSVLSFTVANWMEGGTYDHFITGLMEAIKNIADTQPHLHSLTVNLPVQTTKYLYGVSIFQKLNYCTCTSFVACMQTFLEREHFKTLVLRNVLSFDLAQKLINTFLSLPKADVHQVLDIGNYKPKEPSFFVDPLQSKSLRINGLQSDGHETLTQWLLQLSDVGVDSLEIVDLPSTFHAAVQQQVDGLFVRDLSIVCTQPTRAVDSPDQDLLPLASGSQLGMGPHVRRRYPRRPSPPLSPAFEFSSMPDFGKLLSIPTLHSLHLQLQEPLGFIPITQVDSFLAPLTRGLVEQAQLQSLQRLTLPTLDMNDFDIESVQLFFDALFSLPQLPEFTLTIGFINDSPELIGLIHSSWNRCSQGKTLNICCCTADILSLLESTAQSCMLSS